MVKHPSEDESIQILTEMQFNTGILSYTLANCVL